MSDIRYNGWLHRSGSGGVYQDSSGQVGIGSSVPAGDINVRAQNPNIRFDDSDTANNGEITLDNTQLRIEVDEDDAIGSSQIKFRVDGGDKVTIDDTGKVGISTGTISPDGNQLLIRAKSTFGTTKGHIMLTGDGATNGEGPQIVFSESGSGSNFAGAYVGHVRTSTNSVGDLVFGCRATGGDANTVPTEYLRITSTGKVGINSTTPTFSAGGGVQLRGSGSDFTSFRVSASSNTGVDFSQASDGLGYLYNRDNNSVVLGANNTEIARVKTDGTLSVTNSITTGDAAVNIFKSAGDNTNKAILRVGYDASACFELYRIRNDGRIYAKCAQSGSAFALSTNNSGTVAERIRVASNGYVGINTADPGRYLHIVGNDGPTQATIGNSDTQLVIDNKGSNGAMIEFLSDTNGGGRIFFTDPDASNQGGIEYRHDNDSLNWKVGGTKRMMLGGTGFVYSGNQASGEVAVASSDDAQRGCTLNGGGTNSYHIMASNNHPTLYVCRRASDGTLVTFYHDAGAEGTISVSGSTVSYNGGHLSRWSQLDGISATDKSSRPTIYQGTVMSNLDKLCEWKHPDVLYKDGDVIPDGKSIGDVKEAAYTEDNQQLNMTKVSDTVGDKNVAGVFWIWDDEDDEYVNDFYIAMTGDMVIRVAGSVTVEKGDLMESAGDGTAKPQSDDIIRSKTIAKIASNIATATYADGSKAYPCALMAC